jgi:hypothetical protein
MVLKIGNVGHGGSRVKPMRALPDQEEANSKYSSGELESGGEKGSKIA